MLAILIILGIMIVVYTLWIVWNFSKSYVHKDVTEMVFWGVLLLITSRFLLF